MFGFFCHVATLAGGTALAQGLLILAAPVLTRLYSPADFGLLTVFLALQSILIVVISLRYETAIPLPKQNKHAANLLLLSLSLMLIMCSLLLLISFWIAPWLADSLNLPALENTLWLLPIALAGAGAYQAISFWNSRHKQFSLISRTKIQQSVAQLSVQLLWGFSIGGALGLVLGFLVSFWVGILSLFKKGQPFVQHLAVKRWFALAHIYRDFPLFMLWATLLNVIGWQIPPLLFSAWFSAEVAGLYGLTIRMLGIPAMLIGQAVAQVFYPTVAAEKDTDKQRRLVEQLGSVLLTISISIFAIVFSHAPMIFTWVFGAAWQTAGEYAQWLAPWMLLSFVSSPLSSFALVKSRQRTVFWFTLYETSLRLAVLSMGIYFGSAFLAIAGFAAAGICISLVYIAWILHLAGGNLFTWMWHLRWILLTGSGLWVVTWFSVQMLQPIVSLSVSVLLSLVFLGFAWRSMKHEFVD